MGIEEFEKAREAVEDKLLAQQQSIQAMLLEQERVLENIRRLEQNFSEFEGLIEGMKDSKYNQMSAIKREQGQKASDLLRLNLDQLLRNRSSVMRIQNLRDTLNKEAKPAPEAQVEAPRPAARASLSIVVPKVDDFAAGLDRVEVLLTEQHVKEALEEYRRVAAIEREDLTFAMFLRKQRFEGILIEELRNAAALLKPSAPLDFGRIAMPLDALMDFGKYSEAVEMALAFATSFFRNEYREADAREKISRLLEVALVTITFLSERFLAVFAQSEFIFPFSAWLTAEFESLLNSFIGKGLDDKQVLDRLERLKIDISAFDTKGLGLDFLVDARLVEVHARIKAAAAEDVPQGSLTEL